MRLVGAWLRRQAGEVYVPINAECLRCGAPMSIYPSDIKHGRGRHCSLDCRKPKWPERFWQKMTIGSDVQCWNWNEYLDTGGYGRVWVPSLRREVKSHRVAWELRNGQIPSGIFVLHRCDNRRCCNPSHLFIGTIADNVRDCIRKGRTNQVKGERVYGSRLNGEKVLQIRKARSAGERVKVLAEVYGVSEKTISSVALGRTWAHVQK